MPKTGMPSGRLNEPPWVTTSSGLAAANSRQKMQHFFRFRRREEYGTTQHRTDLVETVFKRGHNSEVAAAAAHAPEKILVFGSIRRQQAPVGGDHLRTDDIVDGESILSVQVTPASA